MTLVAIIKGRRSSVEKKETRIGRGKAKAKKKKEEGRVELLLTWLLKRLKNVEREREAAEKINRKN